MSIIKPTKEESIVAKQEPKKTSSRRRGRKDIVIDINLLLDNSGPATRSSKGKRQKTAMEGEELLAKKAKTARIFYLFLVQTNYYA